MPKVAPRASAKPGVFHRPIHITFIGAGSDFTPRLVSDFLQMPGADRGTFALVDVDDTRLQLIARVVKKLVKLHGKDGWSVVASTKRSDVMPGSHYIVNCIEVGGLDCVKHDYEIPLKYGVDQCIGDTVGPGGVFKALRTIPAWIEILDEAGQTCPEALVLNYTNPMSMMCLAAAQASKLPVVGLCHSVQATSELLARRAGVPYGDLAWECAGINHLAWFTKLEHKGKDLYPALMAKARDDLAGKPSDPRDAGDLVRKDIMVRFGAFVTESSGHLSEYVPYYRKRKDLLAKYCGAGYDGESGFYAREWPKWRK
ncbi:MAG TPA: alpha-glucosidase/alpha-galactosidase, partial [Kiritimatiellia bacterium]